MITYIPEVPGHVQYQDHTSNYVGVKGGSNWDVSRSAIATPISKVQHAHATEDSGVLSKTPYVPNHGVPSHIAPLVVEFSLNGSAIPASVKKVLQKIPKGSNVILAGHASPEEKNVESLSKKRTETVGNLLEKSGVNVIRAHYFSAELPLATFNVMPEANRRVEVFISGK